MSRTDKSVYHLKKQAAYDKFFRKSEQSGSTLLTERKRLAEQQRQKQNTSLMAQKKLGQELNDKLPLTKQQRILKPANNHSLRRNDLKSSRFDFWLKILLWLIIFLVPLFFLTNIPSVIELGKQTFLAVSVGLTFLLWVGRMIIYSYLRFRANFNLVLIFTLVALVGLSAAFSDYFNQSFWGYFGGEFYSYVTLIFLALFFVLFINLIKTKKDLLITLLVICLSGLNVAGFAWLQLHHHFLLSAAVTQSPFFNSTGSLYLLGIYLSAVFLLSLVLLIFFNNFLVKLIILIVSLFFFVLALTVVGNLKMIWIALILAIAFLFGKLIVVGGRRHYFNNVVLLGFLIASLLVILQGNRFLASFIIPNKTLDEFPAKVTLGPAASWRVATQALRQDFLFGRGPAEYVNIYRQFRPLSLSKYWTLDFQSAYSHFLTILPTLGVLAAIVFLLIIFVTLRQWVKETYTGYDSWTVLSFGLGVVWAFLSLILFLSPANTVILFSWWLLLACLTVALHLGKLPLKEFVTGTGNARPSLLFSFLFILAVIGIISSSYAQLQKYLAAVHFNQALKKEKAPPEEIVEILDKALFLDPKRDVYYRNRSLAFFALVNNRLERKKDKLSADDVAYISENIKKALKDARQAVALNPKSVENQKLMVDIYTSLLSSMEEAGDNALEYSQKVIELDPHNPENHYQQGQIYLALATLEMRQTTDSQQTEKLSNKAGEYLALAEKSFQRALEVDPHYLPAKLQLALVYQSQGKLDQAIEIIQAAQREYPQNPLLAFRLGVLLKQKGNLEEAWRQFRLATKLNKDYADAYFYQGLILQEKGREEAARRLFQKVRELDPNNELIRKILNNQSSERMVENNHEIEQSGDAGYRDNAESTDLTD